MLTDAAREAFFPPDSVIKPVDVVLAYAESDDARVWVRPNLGLYEHRGATSINLIFSGFGEKGWGGHGFAPYKDANPDAVFISLAPLWRVTV